MATGNPMLLGKDNTADHVTYVTLLGGAYPEKTYVFRAQAGNRNSHGIRGEGTGTGFGVHGVSTTSGTGVRGQSVSAQGVHGSTEGLALAAAGVFGEATKSGTAVRAKAKTGIGLHATSDTWGVLGAGGSAGVEGLTVRKGGIAVWGHTYGVQGAWAAKFEGPVFVQGDFTQTGGAKSTAVPSPDGTLRRLYSLESPESWFEDFGEARLVRGRAEVRLRSDFIPLIRGAYHVFLTPHGDSRGLYVAARRRRAFVIREQGRGTSSLTFSYRIVARRRDIAAPRLPAVQVPPVPPRRPELPEEATRTRRR